MLLTLGCFVLLGNGGLEGIYMYVMLGGRWTVLGKRMRARLGIVGW